jgi:division protein CdvB (Snf7/Vps24/ESCRT-III family)
LAQRPTSNQGVAQTQDHSTSADMWKRAGSDFEFYQQNRAQLKKQYYEMRNNRFKQ